MRILVTFALKPEFTPWRRRRAFVRTSFVPLPVFVGRADGAEIRVVLTGMGWENAELAMEIALAVRPDFVVSSGLAGGLRSDLAPGDVLAARAVADISGNCELPADLRLLELACACGAQRVEKLLGARRAVRHASAKRRLGRFGEAIEMESFPVLEAAHRLRIPGIAVRAIADTVEQDLPLDFDRTVDENGRVRLPRLLGQLALHPYRLPGLVRLGRESTRAADLLSAFLDRFVVAIAASAAGNKPIVKAVAV